MGVYTADGVVVVKNVSVKEISWFVLDYFVAKASGTDVIIVGNGADKRLTCSDTGSHGIGNQKETRFLWLLMSRFKPVNTRYQLSRAWRNDL
jgi:hypothetical protein